MILKGLVLLVIYLVVAESVSTSQSAVRLPKEYLAPPPPPRRSTTRLRLLRVTNNSTVTKPSSSFATESTTRNARWLFSAEESESKSDRNEHLRSSLAPTQPPQDQVASGTHHHQHQSVAHPYHSGGNRHSKKECNPCNKVPWVPMTRSLIFPDKHEQHTQIVSQYDSPSIGSLPLQTSGTSYGAPSPPLQTPGTSYGAPLPALQTPGTSYGAPSPPLQNLGTSYGAPSPPLQTPGTSYGAPLPPLQPSHPSSSSNHPGSEYGPPPQPPKPIYGPPSSSLESIKPAYGPPSASQSISPTYEVSPSLPPSPISSYGPSPYPTKSAYGPPPQSPKPLYGPPSKSVYHPPSSPSGHIGNSYAPPPPPPQPPKLEYGAPTVHKLPDDEYGPPPPLRPSLKPQYGPPPKPLRDHYGSPPPISQSINHQYSPLRPPPSQSVKEEYGPPPSPFNPPKFGPPSHKPPRAPISNFAIHGSSSKRPTSHHGHPASPVRPISEYGPPSHPKPPRPEYGPPSQSTGPDFRPPHPPTSYDAVKQPSSPQLSPSYLPAPPVYEASDFRGESHSTSQNFITLPPHFNSESSGLRTNEGHNIEIVPSVPLIEDSQAIASHNPTISPSHDISYTGVSSINLHQQGSTTSGFNVGQRHNDETTHPPNDQLHLPSGDTHQPQAQRNQKPIQTNIRDPSLEVIPSIQLADFVSSIEYPLQIIQSPYIDVTQPPRQVQDSSQSSSHSYSTYNEGEIIVGKPTLETTKLNVTKIKNQSTSTEPDQKEQQSVLHLTNTSKTVSANTYIPASSEIIHSSQGNGFLVSENLVRPVNEDQQEKQPQANNNVLNSHVKDTTFNTGLSSSTLNTQPSIQTSAEGNSIIHQINNVFQTESNTPSLSSYQNNFKHSQSGYVLFQNFPQPPLSYLSEDVLKPKLPPPAPFQNNFQQNPYLPPFQSQPSHNFFQSTPQPQTTTFTHALKLEAPVSFLNPPPKDNEQYSTMINTPSNDYSFLTSTSRPDSSQKAKETISGIWNQPTTVSPQISSQKPFEQNILTAFAEAAGLLPPPPHVSDSSNQLNKKTKQIQIIVPYTSSKELMQFKTQEENKPIFDSTGWLPINGDDVLNQQGRKVPPSLVNCNDSSQSWQQQCQPYSWQQQNDYHQNQESRTVTATVPPAQSLKQVSQGYPEKNYSELQHIFASNIRNLLLGEEDTKNVPDSITLQRLQKNIDEWTALEYSKRNKTKYNEAIKKGVTSTTLSGSSHQHLLQPSKKIPEEYLTTTPLTYDDGPHTENHIATAVPSFKKIKSASPSSGNSATLSPFHDFEASASHSHTVRTVTSTSFETNRRKIKDTHTSEIVPLNHQIKDDNLRWKIIESNYVLPEAVTATTEGTTIIKNFTSTYPATTTTFETTTMTTTTEPVTDIYSNSGPTTWDQIPLSISPITNEKVYVVTPMPAWKQEPTQSTSINDVFPFRNGPPIPQKLIASPQFSFKSPRFIVRPTPGTTIHRMFTVSSSEEDDNLNAIKRIKSKEVDEYGNILYNSTLTENTTATPTPSGQDLLLGHSTLPTYTPPNGARVLTDSGHSKVVTVVNSATLTTPIRMKQIKKQSTVATTKLFPVTTSRPQPRGGVPRKLRPSRGSYVWQFPELSGHSFQPDDAEAVQDAVVELQRKQNSS